MNNTITGQATILARPENTITGQATLNDNLWVSTTNLTGQEILVYGPTYGQLKARPAKVKLPKLTLKIDQKKSKVSIITKTQYNVYNAYTAKTDKETFDTATGALIALFKFVMLDKTYRDSTVTKTRVKALINEMYELATTKSNVNTDLLQNLLVSHITTVLVFNGLTKAEAAKLIGVFTNLVVGNNNIKSFGLGKFLVDTIVVGMPHGALE